MSFRFNEMQMQLDRNYALAPYSALFRVPRTDNLAWQGWLSAIQMTGKRQNLGATARGNYNLKILR